MPLVIAVISWIVVVILALTVIGIVLVPFVQFYFQVSIFRMFATAFRKHQPAGSRARRRRR